MADYVKKMSEAFNELAALGEPLEEGDKVQYVLGGYDSLVNTLEGVLGTLPPLEVVTERLLREVQRRNEREEPRAGRCW